MAMFTLTKKCHLTPPSRFVCSLVSLGCIQWSKEPLKGETEDFFRRPCGHLCSRVFDSNCAHTRELVLYLLQQSGTEKPGVNEYKNGSPARVNPACTSDEVCHLFNYCFGDRFQVLAVLNHWVFCRNNVCEQVEGSCTLCILFLKHLTAASAISRRRCHIRHSSKLHYCVLKA